MSSRAFVIVSLMRTGSTMLADLLNRHPDIHCDKEIMLLNPPAPRQLLEQRMALHNEAVYGFMMKLGHIKSETQRYSQRFVRGLSDEGWKVIYVRRVNLFEQAVSIEVARLRGSIYHDTTRSTHRKPASVRLDAQRLIALMKDLEILGVLYKSVVGPLAAQEVIYERDLLDSGSHQATASRVFATLGLPDAAVDTIYRKTVPPALDSFIENYAEVDAALRPTRFGHFLDGVEGR